MFEDEYRNEMEKVKASESLIADTLKKMQEEQITLNAAQNDGEPERLSTFPPPEPHNVTSVPHSPKAKKPLIIKVGLPIAACLVLALVGVLVIPQITNMSSQPGQEAPLPYEFQSVEGNISLSGGLQFGAVDQDAEGDISHLKYAEGSKALLPKGILEATPVSFGDYWVYLGFDEQEETYYAAYRKENAGDTWIVLQSSDLDEAGFTRALEAYFS